MIGVLHLTYLYLKVTGLINDKETDKRNSKTQDKNWRRV